MKRIEIDQEELHAKSLVPKSDVIKRGRVFPKKNRSQPKLEYGKLFFLCLIVSFSCLLVFSTKAVLPSFLISVLLFFIFRPIIDLLERKGLSRIIVIFAVFIVCGISLTFTITKVLPKISQELSAFEQDSGRYGDEFKNRLKGEEEKIVGKSPLFKNLKFVDKGAEWLVEFASKLWKSAPDIVTNLLVAIFLVPFLTFIFLRDGYLIRRRLLNLVPNRYFETFYSISSRVIEEMGGYVAAKIIEAFIVGLLVTMGCLLLKIPYAILLGVFAAATNPIPYLGPLFGAIPALLLATIEPSIENQFIWVSLIYLTANVIDIFFIFPMVVARIVNLHPIFVVLAVIFGSQFFGVLGMILAVPIASILKIFMQELYTKIYYFPIEN